MTPLRNHLQRQSGQMAKLLAKTEQLQQINRVFRAYLPGHLRDHAMITTITAKHWIVQTDSSAWATRLRYVLPQLQQQLNTHLKQEIPPLTVRINPDHALKIRTEPQRIAVSQETAKLLKTTAQNLGDSRLSSALLRLSRRVADS